MNTTISDSKNNSIGGDPVFSILILVLTLIAHNISG